jgi:hypothetical protein
MQPPATSGVAPLFVLQTYTLLCASSKPHQPSNNSHPAVKQKHCLWLYWHAGFFEDAVCAASGTTLFKHATCTARNTALVNPNQAWYVRSNRMLPISGVDRLSNSFETGNRHFNNQIPQTLVERTTAVQVQMLHTHPAAATAPDTPERVR